ncbi:MAG: hypothetical protein IK152_07750 [Lachnospiraceae bacterium]|nr:hypothetical protein [Lachnospiraceae bacterium]MBR5337863.1 hypothetical protein [Lachnospiraceae bacterium]
MKKFILYGDSNTYGYDPRGMMGGRFPDDVRWTCRVAKGLSGYTVLEEGLNGRQLPVSRSGRISRFLENMAFDLGSEDIILMMLGTNDVLLTNNPNADEPLKKMEALLNWYREKALPFKLIVAAPVPIADINDEMEPYHRESLRMNEGFRSICKGSAVPFIDTTDWDIPMAYDGVHIAEESQSLFADKMLAAVTTII